EKDHAALERAVRKGLVKAYLRRQPRACAGSSVRCRRCAATGLPVWIAASARLLPEVSWCPDHQRDIETGIRSRLALVFLNRQKSCEREAVSTLARSAIQEK